jgi:hypothetical protein
MSRRPSFRFLAGGLAAALITSVVAILASVTPAFAVPTASAATWAFQVPYGQAGAPAGLTVTAKTCAGPVTATSGPSGGPGLVINGTNASDLVVVSYGASNTSATSTAVVGTTTGSPLPLGVNTVTFTAYGAGTSCGTSANVNITVQTAVFADVGGAGSAANMWFYDDSYNQSNSQTVDVIDADTSSLGSFSASGAAGTSFGCYNPNVPADVAPGTDPYPNTVTPATAYDHECNLQAALGGNDDSGVTGAASFPAQPVTVQETDGTGTNTSVAYNVIVYNAPICAVEPDTTGAIPASDTTYTGGGTNTAAEAAFDGASGPSGALLTNITAGLKIFTGCSPVDAGGGIDLTIMSAPQFNWTGSVGSGEADVDTGTAGLSGGSWSGATTTSAPSTNTLTGTSTVAASFSTTGDPAATCPPQQALIDAGLPFCFENFEYSGAGPSAAVAFLQYNGQNLPTSQSPTVSLSAPTGSVSTTTPETITDAGGACPASIGEGNFNNTYNCWYGRAGDATSVTVTVDGSPVTVTPTVPAKGDVSEGDFTVGTTSTVAAVTVTSGSDTVTSTNNFATAGIVDGDGVHATGIPAGTTVTNVSGTTLTLSKNATANEASETFTFYAGTTLNPPQLNAQFTIPSGLTAGDHTVQVCESTTPNNGNDWEFGVQYLESQICSTSTFDATTSSGTVTTPTSGAILLGQSNTDTAVVSGSTPPGAPTGSVHFYECGPNASSCNSSGTDLGTVSPLTADGSTATATSASFTPGATGTWCLAAYYSGDVNYGASSDTGADECFSVVNPVAITSGSPPTPMTEGVAITPFQVTTSGGEGPITFSLSGAPSGITIDTSTGVISGTPGFVGGNFSETVTATDTGIPGDNTSQTYPVYVTPSSVLHVTTTSLPAAQHGVAYIAALAAFGGKPPYKWKVTTGSLPKGLKLKQNGKITGTPSATAVTKTFTVTVTDKSHPRQSATATFTITVS